MKIAIVDDDIAMFHRLDSYFGELLQNSAELQYFKSGEAFLKQWQPDSFDLIILDIFMEALTGMDVARTIRREDKNVKLVFCTTSNEFASESYEVDACYYLHKPVDCGRVKAMLDRLNLSKIEEMRSVKLPDGTSAVLRNIIYADFAAHCVTLHGKRGGNTVIRAPFSEIEPLLCAYPYFSSPTKGIVINFYEVTQKNGQTFRMSDGSMIPISRRKAKEVTEAYSSFMFAKLRNGGY